MQHFSTKEQERDRKRVVLPAAKENDFPFVFTTQKKQHNSTPLKTPVEKYPTFAGFYLVWGGVQSFQESPLEI